MAIYMNCFVVNARFNTACGERVSELRPGALCSDAINPDPPCQKFTLSHTISSSSTEPDAAFINVCAKAIVQYIDDLKFAHFRVSSSIVGSNGAAPLQLVSMFVF